ncbi:hypothetical protein HDU78_009395 [Chytriomyces hyalinus]|nr:hypothetical protein HDU78_009395 [Chytriomyces hyalinus]
MEATHGATVFEGCCCSEVNELEGIDVIDGMNAGALFPVCMPVVWMLCDTVFAVLVVSEDENAAAEETVDDGELLVVVDGTNGSPPAALGAMGGVTSVGATSNVVMLMDEISASVLASDTTDVLVSSGDFAEVGAGGSGMSEGALATDEVLSAGAVEVFEDSTAGSVETIAVVVVGFALDVMASDEVGVEEMVASPVAFDSTMPLFVGVTAGDKEAVTDTARSAAEATDTGNGRR